MFPFDRFPGIMRMWDPRSNQKCRPGRFPGRFRSALARESAGPLVALRDLRPERPARRSVPTNSKIRRTNPMLSSETCVEIRRYFYAGHWKIGAIAGELGIHPEAVRHAIESDHFHRAQPLRPSITDPYLEFVRQTLDQHPRLRATRIYRMIHERGYTGGVVQLRRAVARLRPPVHEPFLRLQTFPAEQAQVDWAHFGQVAVGRARRTLSCFVITLSYSRALYLEFFFDQTMENFLRGHGHAFQAFAGQPPSASL
jgi:transposase